MIRVLAAAILSMVFCEPAWAAFTFTADPDRGGKDIRIEDVSVGRRARTEELDFTITTDQAKRYQITQTMHTPLTNQRGDELPRGTLKMFSPSTVLGVLKPKLPTDIKTGTTIVYQSNSAGAQDSFVIAFAADITSPIPPGEYRSQISYTLEAIEGGVTPVILTRNIRMEVLSDFQISIKSTRGSGQLALKQVSRTDPGVSGALVFRIDSSLGDSYTIYQTFSQGLLNAKGDTVEVPVRFRSEGNAPGKFAGNYDALSTSRSPIYKSDDRGLSAEFEMVYEIADIAAIPAGLYTGTLTFEADAPSYIALPKAIHVPVQLEIERQFYIEAEYENASGLYFGSLKKTGDSARRSTLLKVFNNTGERYQVTQVISRLMTNEEGTELDDKNFTYSVKADAANESSSINNRPLQLGESALYVSDQKGSPAEIHIQYEFTLPANVRGGNYTSDLTYSLSSI